MKTMSDVRYKEVGYWPFLIEKLVSDASLKDALNVKNAESVYVLVKTVYVLVKTETTLKSFSSNSTVYRKN